MYKLIEEAYTNNANMTKLRCKFLIILFTQSTFSFYIFMHSLGGHLTQL